ncbi:helix-turn-helix domain-containing protein [Flavobacterium sp. Arc2]|jgi:AraC-like DNA-binding protein|uniref:helix-turn-helix domain-containing protein n=1 Tax=Flavobacterium sp. Arc2 TaxID=3046685 RepID=UPI00352DB676
MVCGRCEMAVKTTLEKMSLPVVSVDLGEVLFSRELKSEEKQPLALALKELGFELLEDKTSKVIEKIKNLIIDLVHNQNEKLKVNFSAFLSDELHQDYSALSKLFSEEEGATIEHYFIAQKIEKAKELLVYDEMSLSEIALYLNYSSVAHLSNQFKKVAGMTPTYFKKTEDKNRKQIDSL